MTDVLDRTETGAEAEAAPAHLMHTLDRTGDTKVSWDPGVREEVKAAEATFDALLKKGYLAYEADEDGESTGVQIRRFNPQARRIVLVKPIVGG